MECSCRSLHWPTSHVIETKDDTIARALAAQRLPLLIDARFELGAVEDALGRQGTRWSGYVAVTR